MPTCSNCKRSLRPHATIFWLYYHRPDGSLLRRLASIHKTCKERKNTNVGQQKSKDGGSTAKTATTFRIARSDTRRWILLPTHKTGSCRTCIRENHSCLPVQTEKKLWNYIAPHFDCIDIDLTAYYYSVLGLYARKEKHKWWLIKSKGQVQCEGRRK
jgi:hypothetical protein